jgi:hypothetical protein
MTDMIEADVHLDRLLERQPLPNPPLDFTEGVMARLRDEPPRRSFWQHPGLQWAAFGLGFGLGLLRLASYVFGAWLALESAL